MGYVLQFGYGGRRSGGGPNGNGGDDGAGNDVDVQLASEVLVPLEITGAAGLCAGGHEPGVGRVPPGQVVLGENGEVCTLRGGFVYLGGRIVEVFFG